MIRRVRSIVLVAVAMVLFLGLHGPERTQGLITPAEHGPKFTGAAPVGGPVWTIYLGGGASLMLLRS
ncbi:MAG: hypothetical protein ACOY94_19740 [Bacillota bacterium]